MGKFIAVIGPNVLAVCYVCVPRPLGGDGVVFAGPAHARTFFLNTNLPRHYCWTR